MIRYAILSGGDVREKVVRFDPGCLMRRAVLP